MSRRSVTIYVLLICLGALLTAATSPSSAHGQSAKKSSSPPGATQVQPSLPSPGSLCPLLAIGIGLFLAAGVGFWASSALERASRSAMHIAKAARMTLLTALAVLLIYSVSVSYLALFR